MKLHVGDKKAKQMFSEGYVGMCSTKCLKDKGFLGETKKQKGGRKRTLKNLTPEQLEYFKSQPQHRRKRLLKDPCWPSTETPECVKLMVKDNPWMLEKGGDKYAQKVVGKKSLLNKEINLKKLIYIFFNIKSSSNIINKFKFALKSVPIYAKITFFLIGILKFKTQ